MVPQVYSGFYYKVETSHGSEIVPCDVVGRTDLIDPIYLQDYVTGQVDESGDMIGSRAGWLARLSMPGYLDCTDWTAHNTEAQAIAYLADMYGDSGEGDL